MECLRSITPLAHLTLPKTATKPHPRICARSLRGLADSPVVQPRENARIQSGRSGFDAHRARQFRRAVEFGLSAKAASCPQSGSNPVQLDNRLTTHLASCPSSFRMGRCASVIELGSSTALEHLVKTRRCGFDSRPETSKPPLVHPPAFSTGRRIGLSFITTWSPVRVRPPEPNAGVAQLVEHVIPSSFLIRRFFQRAVDCGFSWTRRYRCKSSPSLRWWCNFQHTGQFHSRSLARA